MRLAFFFNYPKIKCFFYHRNDHLPDLVLPDAEEI